MPFSTPPALFMLSAWLLPEHIADVLPAAGGAHRELRRTLLDRARTYGFELVMPPLLEHLESLLSGTGRELDLRTFKLVDQLSGRTLGLRADTTPQAARIDAHLLNREGVTRLCYCGPVLHTRRAACAHPRAAAVRRRDLRPRRPGGRPRGQELALDACGLRVPSLVMDLADARMLRGVLAGVPLDAQAARGGAGAVDKDAAGLAGCG
jgi:ATP phosphoribosyltransferase regulatory subunit